MRELLSQWRNSYNQGIKKKEDRKIHDGIDQQAY